MAIVRTKAKSKAPRVRKAVIENRDRAAESGLLPHEWLLRVARGDGIEHRRWQIKRDAAGNEIERELCVELFYADFGTRIDAAKAAAPYFAPKLQSTTVSGQLDLSGAVQIYLPENNRDTLNAVVSGEH